MAERAREQAYRFGAEILLHRTGIRGAFLAGRGIGYLDGGTKIIARVRRAREEWDLLMLYEKFEQVVILILTGLIAIVVVFAVWNLAPKIFHAVTAPQTFDPTQYAVFQAVFGAMLEFKRSLLVVARRQENIVQVRTVILIALLAIVRKLMILDLASTEALQLFACSSDLSAWCRLPARSRPRSQYRAGCFREQRRA